MYVRIFMYLCVLIGHHGAAISKLYVYMYVYAHTYVCRNIQEYVWGMCDIARHIPSYVWEWCQ